MVRKHLFIDRLSLTFPIPDRKHNTVRANLETLCLDAELEKIEDRYSDLLKGYRSAYRLMFDDDLFCAIQIQPHKRGHRFMRLEWNPNAAQRVCAEATLRILVLLRRCLEIDPLETLARAKITRIDLSFNLRRVSLNSFFISTQLHKAVSGDYLQYHHTYARDGYLNARYIGKADSNKYLLMYDKRLHTECALIRKNPQTTERANGLGRPDVRLPKITRFELRLRRVGTLEKLMDMRNPWAQYSVTQAINTGGVRNDHLWQFFILSCKQIGAQAALSMIEDFNERNRFRKALNLCGAPNWWNPDVIRAELPRALAEALGVQMESQIH
jgi:hypothetical protein